MAGMEVLQGIGGLGEDASKGAVNSDLMKHQFTMDYLANQARSRGLDITQQGQQQQYQLARTSQDLMQQQITDAGYKDVGFQKDDNGNWQYVFANPRTGENRAINFGSTPPHGTWEYQNNIYNTVKHEHPEWPDDYAASVAFGSSAYMRDVNEPNAIFAKAYKDAQTHPEYLNEGETPQQHALSVLEISKGENAYFKALQGGYAADALDKMSKDDLALFDAEIGKPRAEMERQKQAELAKLPPYNTVTEWFTGTHAKAIDEINKRYQPQEDSLNLRANALLQSIQSRRANKQPINDLLSSGGGAISGGAGSSDTGLQEDAAGNYWKQTPTGPVWAGRKGQVNAPAPAPTQ